MMGNSVVQPINRRGVCLVCCVLRTLGFLTRMQIHVLKMLAWIWVKGRPGKGIDAVCICTITFIKREASVLCRNGFLSKICLFILPTDCVEVSEKSWGIKGEEGCLSLLLPLWLLLSFSEGLLFYLTLASSWISLQGVSFLTKACDAEIYGIFFLQSEVLRPPCNFYLYFWC